MYISIDFDSNEALYIQLRNQIILAIVRQDLTQGQNLPSVRDMAEQIGINMHTVNKGIFRAAAGRLCTAGPSQRSHGVGGYGQSEGHGRVG